MDNHNNLYNESQPYHLFLEDGHKVLFLPGIVYTWQIPRRGRKIFQENHSFLCPEFDFQISEGNFDDNDLSDEEKEWAIDLTCEIDRQNSCKLNKIRTLNMVRLNVILILNAISSLPVIFKEFMMQRTSLFLKMRTAQ